MRYLPLMILLLTALSVWASEPPAGRLSLKMAPQAGSVREARKRLAAVDAELARLQLEIVNAKSQAGAARATGGTNAPLMSTAEAVASAYEAQRIELLGKRQQLIQTLKSGDSLN
jgi:hypothetical protein